MVTRVKPKNPRIDILESVKEPFVSIEDVFNVFTDNEHKIQLQTSLLQLVFPCKTFRELKKYVQQIKVKEEELNMKTVNPYDYIYGMSSTLDKNVKRQVYI